jgi:cell division septum initiation protein DivIVA
MKDRVKVLLNGTSSEGETSEHALVSPPQQQPQQPAHPNQALQVLTLAQRTAEEHVARAHHQADKIRTDALAAAEQIARDAQVHAHNVRREADKVLTDARAASEQVARDSHSRTEESRRIAEKIVAEARAQSEQIVAEARASSEHLNLQARQRYDDVVGSLGTKREALQNQIEALELFDREYRSRLTTFMQGQLRALWVEQPQVNVELPDQPLLPETGRQFDAGQFNAGQLNAGQLNAGQANPGQPDAGQLDPAQAQAATVDERASEAPVAGPRHGADDAEDAVPAQRQSPEEDENDDEEELTER